MKRVITLLLAAALALSIAACGKKEANKGVNNIQVAVAFMENEQAVVVTRQTGDKELKSLELTCLFYDEEGKPIGETEIITCETNYKSTFHTWTFVPAFPVASKYVEATVSAATYADDSKDTYSGVKTWEEESRAAFSLESYQQKLEAIGDNEAKVAADCREVTFSATIAEGALNVTVKNESKKQIEKLELYILWFDEAGRPIDMKDMPFKNSEKLSATNLAADQEGQYVVTPPEYAASVKGVVKDITFADGTIWENTYMYEWAMVNHAYGE